MKEKNRKEVDDSTGSGEIKKESGFISETAWSDTAPDCLVVCCSDHRFEQATRELAHKLGFSNPHFVQIPSGPTMTLPLVSMFGFMGKATDKIIEGVVEMKHLKTILFVGHIGCGAYKAAEHPLIGAAMKFAAGKTVVELQKEHLRKAAKRMQMTLRGVQVQAYFANVIETEGGDGQKTNKVKFEEV